MKKEIEIIVSTWTNFIILIDDFQVPGDDGYGYDDYGPGKVLDVGYVSGFIKAGRVDAYSPSIPAAQETGFKRGYVFLTPAGMNTQMFANGSDFRKLLP